MKDTLSISKANAVKAYQSANKETKDLLVTLFGKETFDKGQITDRIKTFGDVCEELGDKHQDIIDAISEMEQDEAAYIKLKMIAEALNEGWKPDWSNTSQYKYHPYLKFTPGSGFSYFVFDYGSTHLYVGSRLCFKSEALAKYAATQFEKEYNEFFQ